MSQRSVPIAGPVVEPPAQFRQQRTDGLPSVVVQAQSPGLNPRGKRLCPGFGVQPEGLTSQYEGMRGAI